MMKLPCAIAFMLFLASCSSPPVRLTDGGVFRSGTLVIANTRGNVDVYPPERNAAADRYTLIARSPSATVSVLKEQHGNTLRLSSSSASADLLVRVPNGVRTEVSTARGAIHVTDVTGPVDASTQSGDIKIQIPAYASASTKKGNVSVIFGNDHWPGTLNFSTMHGDVEVYVPATANARVDLHTERGSIFTDFNLRGTSQGNAETIIGILGKGGNRTVRIRVADGSIRVLKLVPQM